MNYKKSYNYFNKAEWKKFSKNEIFFQTCCLMKQSHFSPALNYYQFKRRLAFIFLTKLHHFCLNSKNNRSLISKFKLTRHSFNRTQNFGSFTGIYKSMW